MLEKIAKRLKRFTLDEISLYVETDSQNQLNSLIEKRLLAFDGKFYEYIESKNSDLKIIKFSDVKSDLYAQQAVKIFITDYAKQNCSEWSQKTYVSIFNTNILPFFKGKLLSDITIDDVANFNKFLENKGLSDYRIKNSLMLLNQLLHYFQEKGVIPKTCDFKVRRLNKTKNEKVILSKTEVENILKLAKSKDKNLHKLLFDIATGEEKFTVLINKNDFYFRKGRSKKMEEKRLRAKFRDIKIALGLEKIKFDTLIGTLKGEK